MKCWAVKMMKYEDTKYWLVLPPDATRRKAEHEKRLWDTSYVPRGVRRGIVTRVNIEVIEKKKRPVYVAPVETKRRELVTT